MATGKSAAILFVVLLSLSPAFAADDPGPDPKANLEQGKKLAFEESRWAEALPLLAAGNDADLRRLASADLAASDGGATIAKLVTGHDWWDWSFKQDGAARAAARERASYWYRVGLPELPDDARRRELTKLIDTAEAESDAFHAKAGTPRPIDADLASLGRAAVDNAETALLGVATADKDATFSPRPDGKPFALGQQGLAVTSEAPITLTFDAGTEVRGGTIDLRRQGHLVAKGTADKPVVFRKVVFLQDLDASLTATHAVFDQCQFNKGGAWFSYHSSKWTFDDCLLYRSAFAKLTGVDYGFQIRHCALVGMELPEIAHNRDDKFDHMTALRGEWNQIESSDFAACTLPPTVVWCARSSNFTGCRFLPGEAFESAKDAEVTAFLSGTSGEDPQHVWAKNPPAHGAVHLSAAPKPFETTRFAKGLTGTHRPVPEVGVSKGRVVVEAGLLGAPPPAANDAPKQPPQPPQPAPNLDPANGPAVPDIPPR